ncbi:MAG: hypothetical protein AAF604_04810 [Acidobacteriota bacterium]
MTTIYPWVVGHSQRPHAVAELAPDPDRPGRPAAHQRPLCGLDTDWVQHGPDFSARHPRDCTNCRQIAGLEEGASS